MKQKIIDFIKCNSFVFFVYNRIVSMFVRFVSLLIPIDDKKVLFVSFGGKKYDDSPKDIYEMMINMPEFDDYNFIWAFLNTERDILGNAKKVKIDSWKYFYHALSAKFWIVNVSAERGLNFKKKQTICINTWHGTPIKKIYGEENEKKDNKFKPKVEKFELVCAQSEYDQDIFARIFKMDKKDIIISDLPRNDCLLQYSEADIIGVKHKINIPLEKKVVLYMPTYREYERDSTNACFFLPPIDLTKWKKKLGEQYVLLFRAHYLVMKNMEILQDGFVYDVSSYPQLSDLYAISDMMISDYSSSFFDYAILERPELCFAYDLEVYEKKRGFYIDIKKELPCDIKKTEDEIIEQILMMNYEEECERTRKFKNKYVKIPGCATERVIKEIIERYI